MTSKGVVVVGRTEVGTQLRMYAVVNIASPQKDKGRPESATRV